METRTTDIRSESPANKPLILRNPKACQECRQRKIKCDAAVPCKHCKSRNRECVYRGVARPRRKNTTTARNRRQLGLSEGNATTGNGSSGGSGDASREMNRVQNNSVTATHLASPSCELQLYYGPTSNFSVMQQIYRHLTSNTNPHSSVSHNANNSPDECHEKQAAEDEIEEAGPGLDLFSFRRLFFGDIERSNRDGNGSVNEQPLMFLPIDLAERFLERYLATAYHFTSFLEVEEYRVLLRAVYAGTDPGVYGSSSFILLLLCMAIGAAMMDCEPWAETLFQKAKAEARVLDDVVNLQAVQVPLLMALFQTENGRPNSAFLYMGCATRKALAAGLHKGVNLRDGQTGKEVKGRKATLWAVYHFETWWCFTSGRRSSILKNDINVPDPIDDPFTYSLVELSKIISDTSSRIYGSNHRSLLSVSKAADQTYNDLRNFSKQHFGVDPLKSYIPPKTDEVGFKEAGLVTAYCHTILLIFRPFLIFRVKRKTESSSGDSPSSAMETPKWLDAACDYALEAARYVIRYVTEGCELNELIREFRYHGFFLEGACFCMIYDSLLYPGADSPHLPWIKAALRCVYTMIPRNSPHHQTSNVFNAIYKMYVAVCPGTALSLDDVQGADMQGRNSAECPSTGDGYYLNRPNSTGPSAAYSQGSREQSLSDIASQFGLQREADWDFNFPTVDLESFLSVDPTAVTNGELHGFAGLFSAGPL